MTTEIALSRGLVALVDDEDAAAVLAYRWNAKPCRQTVYAQRSVRRPDGRWTTQPLHLFLTGYARTDHRNGDGLDNRRANLRGATNAENLQNQRIRSDNSSGYKGVCWFKASRKWRARITVEGRELSLGMHLTPEDAARSYDAAAREHYGAYAAVNFPLPGERAAWGAEE